MSNLIDRQAAIDALGERPMVWVESDYELGARNQYDADVLALETVPSAQPEKRTETNTCDTISRQAALEAMDTWDKFGCDPDGKLVRYDDDKHYVPYVHYEDMVHAVKNLSSAQPEIVRCKDCKYSHMTYDGDCKYCDIWFPDEPEYMPGDYYCGSAERRQDE